MLGNFVSGLLLSNCVGAYYMGRVHSRVLDIRLVNGKRITVEDFENISANLQPNRVYQFLLKPTILNAVEHFSHPPDNNTLPHAWQGVVINSVWQPAPNRELHFTACTRTFQEMLATPWVLVWTNAGNVLISPQELHRHLGGVPLSHSYLRWRATQWSLLAVLDHVNLWLPRLGG